MNSKRLLLLLIAIGFLTSYGQQTKEKKDFGLLMPRESEADNPTAEDYQHSLELKKEQAILTLNGKKQPVSYDTLSSMFKNKKAIIKSRVFSIITHSETSYKTVVDVLDHLAINNIERYKLLGAKETLNHQPNVEPEKEYTDSSFLNITIIERGYTVMFLNQTTERMDTTALDQYIADNRSKIDADKVLIDCPASLPYESFKPLLEVLKKHELYKFRMPSHK